MILIRCIFLFIMMATSVLCLEAQQFIEEDFSVQWVSRNFNSPTGITFDHEGKMIVWEKGGKIFYYVNDKKIDPPLLDISEEVTTFGDYGLMGLALDPNFNENGYFYVYYAVDYHHLKFYGTPSYDPQKTDQNKATIGRVTRYQADQETSFMTIVPGSRKILIGKTIDTGIPLLHTSHMGGTLTFGEDGSLLISAGDASTWEELYVGNGPPYFGEKVEQALEDGIISDDQNLGALRAQYINSYNGKILRIDPKSGLGIPSNPFYNSDNPDTPASKVWAMGFRNPFRISLRDETGSLNITDGLPGSIYVGDVGGAYWEELNVITVPGRNYGWPIFEGNEISEYKEIPTRHPVIINPCDPEGFKFTDLIQQPNSKGVAFSNPCDQSVEIPNDIIFVHERPALVIAHITKGLGLYKTAFSETGEAISEKLSEKTEAISKVGDIRGNAIIAGDFYNGNKFPESHWGDLFTTDYNNGWISRVEVDLNDNVTGIFPFYKDTFYISHLEVNKHDGCVYFIQNPEGIRKICYNVNVPPLVTMNTDKNYGPSPLTVSFDASETVDPDGDELTFEWDFGNGIISTEINPIVTFENDQAEAYNVTLTVKDGNGNEAKAYQLISINNTPPDVKIINSGNPEKYSVVANNDFIFKSEINDIESESKNLEKEWTLILHHNTHYHEEEFKYAYEARFLLPPVGCGDEIYYFRVRLNVTDEHGLTGTDEVYIYPDCEDVFARLLFYNIQLIGNEVYSNWRLDKEEDVAFYEIQRSGNNEDFFTIGTIDADSRVAPKTYEYFDSDPLEGPNYYRIKLVGNSGNYAFSDVRFAIVGAEGGLHVFPNPSNGNFNIHFNQINSKAEVKVFSVDGIQIFNQDFEGIGTERVEINLPNALPSGIYFMSVQNGENYNVVKIVLNQ